PELARRDLERAVGALGDLHGALEDLARVRAGELLETHRRVREGSRATGAFTVEPQLPVDVVGIYVFLPVAEV
ncbi:MAG: hypothetical protein KY452_11100, partial [Actinobacteria bacterium]|nr:hypothetical protein [Actinomycetota bacterium]